MTTAAESATAIPVVAPAEVAHKRPYVYVFIALAAITAVEVYVAGLGFLASLDRISLLIVMATTKASLVAAYYMHLKYEPRWIMLIPFGALALVFVLVAALTAAAGTVPATPLP